jgi:hypothetical protein
LHAEFVALATVAIVDTVEPVLAVRVVVVGTVAIVVSVSTVVGDGRP